MDPITISAIAVGLFMAACSGQKTEDSTTLIGDSNSHTAGIDTHNDAALSDTALVDTPIDTFVGPIDIEEQDTGTNKEPNQCPTFPLKGLVKLLTQSPCGKGASITDLDASGLGICSDFNKSNMLFQFGTAGITQSMTLTILPDQIDQSPMGTLAITGLNSAYQAGILQFPSITATPTWTPFETITMDGKAFIPSYPKGIAYHSGYLFVVTGNISFATGKPEYSPGTVLIYSNDQTKPQVLLTQGQNPSSMSEIFINGKPMLAVVNTGNYNVPTSNPDNKGSLTIIDPATRTVAQTIPLPRAGFGLSGEMAVAGGKLAIGSADNSGQTIIFQLGNLNAAAQLVPIMPAPSGESHFITTTILSDDGKHLVSGDFNTGKLRTFSISDASAQQITPDITVDDNPSDNQNIGDGFCMGGKLYVAVGNNIMEIQ